MSTHPLFLLSVVCGIVFFVGATLAINELSRRHRRREQIRNVCMHCGSTNVERRHIRVKLPDDPLGQNPRVSMAVLLARGDFICQTQRRCVDGKERSCITKGTWQEEKTVQKFFNLIRRMFRPHHCRENGTPDDLVGHWCRQLTKKGSVEKPLVKPHLVFEAVTPPVSFRHPPHLPLK